LPDASLCDRHEAGHAAALGVFAAHRVAGALRRHHDDVDAGLRLDQAEMHVEAVGKGDRRAFAQVVMHVFAVGLGLKLVGHGEHDQVAPGGGLGDAHDLQALALGLGGAGRAFAQRHDDVLRAAVAQVQRVGMTLGAIAQDRHLLVLDQVHIAIAIVVDAHIRHNADLRPPQADVRTSGEIDCCWPCPGVPKRACSLRLDADCCRPRAATVANAHCDQGG
jgi:hypothetical protein